METAPQADLEQFVNAPLLERPEKPLKGQWALITGATRFTGLGFAIAERLALEGASIVVVGTVNSQDIAPYVVDRLKAYGVQADSLIGDVTQNDSCVEMVTKAYELAGNVNILVNNAGASRNQAIVDVTLNDYNHVYNPKALGTLQMSREWFRIRSRKNLRGGRIVNIGSVVGPLYGNYGQAAYAMANGAVMGLTRDLALELGTRGVMVNMVAPTFIPGTEITKGMEEQIPMIKATTPNNELPTAQEISGTVAWLVSPDAAHIGGEIIPVQNNMNSNFTALRPLSRAQFLV